MSGVKGNKVRHNFAPLSEVDGDGAVMSRRETVRKWLQFLALVLFWPFVGAACGVFLPWLVIALLGL